MNNPETYLLSYNGFDTIRLIIEFKYYYIKMIIFCSK